MDEFDVIPERDGELELPDDLALMGEQLMDDAQRLAACYPPQYGPVQEVAAAIASVSPQRQSALRTAWFVGSAGSGLVALGLLFALALNWNQPPMVEDPTVASGGSVAVTPNPAPADANDPPVFSTPASPLNPAVLQRGVTGAEMEGLMDLQLFELALDTESLEF